MTIAASIGFLAPAGLVIATVGLAVAIGAAWFVTRRSHVRSRPLRLAVAAMRATLLFGLALLLADPVYTYDAERRPRLRVVWDEKALEGVGTISRAASAMEPPPFAQIHVR